MSTALEIKKAIEAFPKEELGKLCEWFAEREAGLAASDAEEGKGSNLKSPII